MMNEAVSLASRGPRHRLVRRVERCLIGAALLAPALAMATVPEWLSPRLREHPLAGAIVNARGEKVPESELLAALGSARFAFVGEKHDNPDHHQIELRLIRDRLASQPGSAVVFEMLDDAQRPALGSLGVHDSLEQIREKLSWPAKGWDFAVYGPLFQASAKQGRLMAGNVGRKFIGEVYAKGEAALTDDRRFTTVSAASAETRAHLLERIHDAHCGMAARDTLGPMVAIQLAKDASMASAMADGPPALLIAGGEHVRADTGAPGHLQSRIPEASRVVIQLLEVTEGEADPRPAVAASGPADYYWFTPATEVRDHCADVKGRAATGAVKQP